MFEPSYKRTGIKTKNDAFAHIIACLIENPAVADNEGTLPIMLFGKHIVLKPVKKKKRVYEDIN